MLQDTPMKIAEITSIIKEILEGSFPSIILEGEISNCRPSSTGHLYFTLKDETSSISAVMFKGKARYLPFTPKDGILVKASGSISVYEARGTYQIIVSSMDESGSGDILRILEQRKQRLASEGLFDSDKKRTIPLMPESVAVITSPTGAAIKDFLQIIRRRNSAINITILPAPVQGTEAAKIIEAQIETANRFNMADVIVITRGGGSIEDLLPFSDEDLVRAVSNSTIPVISAIGHEIDWSLCDYAADLRVPTPSAAAEFVSPLKTDIINRISDLATDLISEINDKVSRIRLILNAFTSESLELRFRRIEQPKLLRFDDAKEALLSTINDRIQTIRHRLLIDIQKLEGVSPSAILKRGYSVVCDAETGKILRSAEDTCLGRTLLIRPGTGSIKARVEETIDEKI